MSVFNSDSTVQRLAEAAILEAFARQREETLVEPVPTISLGTTRLHPDAVTLRERYVVEAFARQGALKPGQKKKVAQDILKLALLRQTEGWTDAKPVIAFADEAALASVTGWLREAAAQFKVELVCVEIDEDLREGIRHAQARQVMVNVEVDEADVLTSDAEE